MLVLRTSGASPFARKTLIVAALLGLEDRIEVLAADTNDPDDSLRRENPLGKIPALILESGETIFDSAVIVEYLDWLAGGGQVIPTEPQARFKSLTRQALADGIAEAAVLQRYEIVWREPSQRSAEVARPSGRQDRPRAQRLRGRAARGAQRRRHGRACLRPRLSRPALRRRLAGGTPQARRLAQRLRRGDAELRDDAGQPLIRVQHNMSDATRRLVTVHASHRSDGHTSLNAALDQGDVDRHGSFTPTTKGANWNRAGQADLKFADTKARLFPQLRREQPHLAWADTPWR